MNTDKFGLLTDKDLNSLSNEVVQVENLNEIPSAAGAAAAGGGPALGAAAGGAA